LLSGDVFTRYYRMRGHDTLYVSGSDAHGTRVEFEALQLGIPPAELAQRNHERILEILDGFGIRFDNYTTTESPTHKAFVREIYLQMEANGYICTQVERRAYCTHCEKFLADRFITGTCPRCGSAQALGNQCDACGAMLEPEELIDPRCAVCGGATLEFRETKHWYLDLARLAEPLQAYVESRGFQWNVDRYTQQMIADGLRPRAMTRDIDWGIPAPFDGAEGKVIYVWGEAALGYVSAVVEQFGGGDRWKAFWFGDDIHQVYTLGKDNIAFHTLIFPGQLIASGVGYHLPDQIAATEYLNWIGGQRFSKTRGIGLYGDDALALMDGDLWRFYLLYNRPEGRDVDFSWEELEKAVNGVLISNLANLINRVLSFVQDRHEARVPEAQLDPEVAAQVAATLSAYEAAVASCELGKALRAACALAVFGNEYFQRKAPWSSGDEAAVTSAFHAVRALALLLYPFVPRFGSRVLAVMGIDDPAWDRLDDTPGGTRLTEDRVLLERIDIAEMQHRAAERVASEDAEEGRRKPEIAYEAFSALDLRIGTIVAADPVPGADRLYRLTIELGAERRVSVSGIRETYRPEELIGRRVAVLANLAPATIRGIRSECMLLAADDGTGPALLGVDRDVAAGAPIV
jgi:methionyl-tRNA synthetase